MESEAIWAGIYAAYMTGKEGQGFAMFVFDRGIVSGADPLGVRFDGKYEVADDFSLAMKIRVSVPPDGVVIQGVNSGPSGLTYEVELSISQDDVDNFFTLPTPLGPVNVRLEKLRSMEGNIHG